MPARSSLQDGQPFCSQSIRSGRPREVGREGTGRWVCRQMDGSGRDGCFYKLGVRFVGVLAIEAPFFRVYILGLLRPLSFGNSQMMCSERRQTWGQLVYR